MTAVNCISFIENEQVAAILDGNAYMSYRVFTSCSPLQWRHTGRDGISNHQPHDCLLNRLFRHRSKKESKLRATGLCVGNSPVTGEFPAQMASNAETVSIWWRHHVRTLLTPPDTFNINRMFIPASKYLALINTSMNRIIIGFVPDRH